MSIPVSPENTTEGADAVPLPTTILLPITLPVAVTTDPIRVDPVTVPVELINPAVSKLPPVTLPVALNAPVYVNGPVPARPSCAVTSALPNTMYPLAAFC